MAIKTDNRNEINAEFWNAILQLGQQARDAGIEGMTPEEIDTIIEEVRDGK